jgi:hypothetical protein
MTHLAVAILGPMRSGTAAVSQVVHYLGFNAGVAIHAPVPPAWRSDWEDLELSQALSQLLPLGDDNPDSSQRTAALNFLATYVRRRMDWRATLEDFTGSPQPGWSMKSPLLALFLDELRAAVSDEEDLRLRTICVMREPEGLSASWNRTLGKIKDAVNTQFGIARALKGQTFTLLVNYDELVLHPQRGVLAIAGALGVDDPEAIERAISVVRQPTAKGVPAWSGSRV